MAVSKISVLGLVPARSGSKRVPDKNIRRLGGHPLMAYTIAAAQESGVFDRILLSTDSADYAAIGQHYGADAPFLRPETIAGSDSPDFQWIEYTLQRLRDEGESYDAIGILRPTSPFRLPETLRRAWELFSRDPAADSLRAVEKVKQHPGKMWVKRANRLLPLLPFQGESQPWHSMQSASLPEIYVQNASLELAWTRVILEGGTIAGEVVIPFITEGFEGFDINDEEDWRQAEDLISSQRAIATRIAREPYLGGEQTARPDNA